MKRTILCLLAAAMLLLAGCSKPQSAAASSSAAQSSGSAAQSASASQPEQAASSSASAEPESSSSASSSSAASDADGTMKMAWENMHKVGGTIERLTLDENGEKFILYAEGAVEAVSLKRVAYQDDGTFAEGETLWSADRLESGDALIVTAVIPEGAPDLQLSWTGAGGGQKRLISESGKDGSALLLDAAGFTPDAGFQPLEITDKLSYNCDLDGNGSEEEISVIAKKDGDVMHYGLYLVENGNSFYSAETKIIYNYSVWLADLNSDGKIEIYMSGDMASDDYVTYGWTFGKRGLEPVAFSGDDRPDTYATEQMANGAVTAAEGGELTLRSSVYMLGTYIGTRNYLYGADGTLQPKPDTLWAYTGNENWLKLIRELPVTLSDGSAAKLPAGTSLLLTGSDGVSKAMFRTSDQKTGTIALTRNNESWGWLIGGAAESGYFESLPYAD